MGHHLLTLADAVAADADRSVASLPMVTDDERRQLRSWNGVRAEHGEGGIHELIERQAAQHPEAVAVVAGASRITYAELNARANQLARYLRELGVTANTPVGIFVERSSPDLVIGVLGILKAGGAFLPLDQAQPAERLKFMFLDSGAPLLLTQAALLERWPSCGGRVVVLDRDGLCNRRTRHRQPRCDRDGWRSRVHHLHVGSTGHPKGVLLEHRGLWNVALEQQRLFRPGPGSRVLQFASLSFDAAVFDLVMALGSGASLHLASRMRFFPVCRFWKL
jgi:non-ribosomal peptide synthetase component F